MEGVTAGGRGSSPQGRSSHAARGARDPGYRVVVLRRAALGLLLALTFVPVAVADGDPASDYLQPPDVRVYMTNSATDQNLVKGLQSTAQRVSDAGLPIKVAIIGNKTDLGAVPVGGSPQQLAAFQRAEQKKWAKVIQFSGASVD